MTITRRARTTTINGALLVIGLVASLWLLYFEESYHFELGLGIIAVVALVALDQRDDPRFTVMTALMPFIVLLVIADVFYDPTRGIVVQGMEMGALVALLAVGIALIYRANRVINFAQGDLGAAPAIFVLLLIASDAPGGAPDWMTGLPYPVAFVLGLISAVFLGFVVERLIINRFSRSPRLVLTVATIGVSQLLVALVLFMPGWFGFKNLQVPVLDPPIDKTITIGGTNFDPNDVMIFIVVPIVLVLLTLFVRYTRVGIAMRAAAERADRAATLGVPVGRIQTTVWVITTVLAFITVFLRAGVASFPIGSALGIKVLIPALGAAVIGRLDNFPRIAAAAIGLGVIDQAIVYNTGRDLYTYPVLFVIIAVALFMNRRHRSSRVEDQAVSTWQAAQEMRPVPPEMKKLPEVRLPTWIGAAALAIFVVTLPMWLTDSRLYIAAATAMMAIVAVSLVILTGWAGHISLGQLAFAGIGGGVSVWLTQSDKHYVIAGVVDTRLFFWALLISGLAGAAVAVIVGLPAARAGGLTLAVVTLALASPVAYYFLNPEFFDFIPRNRFEREPELFRGVDISSQTSYFYLTLGVLAIAVIAAYIVRRGRLGRVLIAMRDNPRGAEAYGVNTIRTTLVSFAISGFFAAVAGALFVHQEHFIHQEIGFANPFSPEQCIRIFSVVVIGGLASIPGAILGTVYVFFVQYNLPSEWRFLATGFGLLLILLVLPGGLGAGLAEARDGTLRFIARRRKMIVPSLLADRKVEDVDMTDEMVAAVADAVERPDLEDIMEVHQ